VWLVTLVATFLHAKTHIGVMRGNVAASGLTALALVATFFSRGKGSAAAPQADTTLGGARRASRQELAAAGCVMRYDEITKTYHGGKGIPLGSFEEWNPLPEQKTFGIKRHNPERIVQPWNGLSHPNTLVYASPSHLITIAPTGSGKARDTLIPALLSDGIGSAVVIDPKGQLAAVTAAVRMSMGRKVYCLNPFGLHADRLPPATGFNPMASLDPTSAGFGVDCDSIATAAHTWDRAGDSHWNDSSVQLVSGIVMHLAKYGEPDMRNLARGDRLGTQCLPCIYR